MDGYCIFYDISYTNSPDFAIALGIFSYLCNSAADNRF